MLFTVHLLKTQTYIIQNTRIKNGSLNIKGFFEQYQLNLRPAVVIIWKLYKNHLKEK